MLVFNGGLNLDQVEKLKDGYPIIYDKVPYRFAEVSRENTFDYVPKVLYNAPGHIFRRYISEDCYSKQYIFLAKYLQATLGFCSNSEKRNYIMVCDIPEVVLDNYIGVGNYDDYRIEYRVPRVYITPDTIKEFLYFEPYDDDQILEFQKRYEDSFFISPTEDEKAKKLMLERNLQFNGRRTW